MSFFRDIMSAISGVPGVTGLFQSGAGQVTINGATPLLTQQAVPQLDREQPTRRTRAAKPKGKPATAPAKRGRPAKAADANTTVPAPATNGATPKLTERIARMLPTEGSLSSAQIAEATGARVNHVGIALNRLRIKGRAIETDGGWSRPIAAEATRAAA